MSRVVADVATAAEAGDFDETRARVTYTRFTVDDEAWGALAREFDELVERMTKLDAATRERLASTDDQSEQKAAVVVMLLRSPP